MSEEIRDGILFVTGPLSNPYEGLVELRARERFWDDLFSGADLTEDQRRAVRENLQKFKEAAAWFKENRMIIPPNVVGTFQAEANELLESLGYAVTLDPGFMPS